MQTRLATILAITLLLFATSASAISFNFGVKGEIAKGVEKALAKKPVCVGWLSGKKDAMVIMEDDKSSWREHKKLLTDLEESGFVTLGLNTLSVVLSKGPSVTTPDPDRLYLDRLQMHGHNPKEKMYRYAILTDYGKAVHTTEGYKREGWKYWGLCSPTAKYELDKVVRWSEPTPTEGKTVTEAVFSVKANKLDGAFVKYFEKVNLGEFDLFVKLYKTSDGWLPLGQVQFKKKTKD